MKASPLQPLYRTQQVSSAFNASQGAISSVNGDALGPTGSGGPGVASVRFGPDRRAIRVVRVTEGRVNGRGSGQHVSRVGERG